MTVLDREELSAVLTSHRAWLRGDPSGQRANLSGANLEGTDFMWANLARAWFAGANLRGADLAGANLERADLAGANLAGADLSGASLRRARLAGANLAGASLAWTDLAGANFEGAILTGTVLDPANVPNGDVEGFERDGDWVIGWRTRESPCVGDTVYEKGKHYEAPVFSTCAKTECHSGLYLFPQRKRAEEWTRRCRSGAIIRVRALAANVHRVGRMWRCKAFEVLS